MVVMNCTVRRQLLNIDIPTIVSGSYDYINVVGSFSSEWDGMQKWIHIRNVENPTVMFDALFVNNEIGADTGLNLTAGQWDVWIHGASYVDNTLIKRLTTQVKLIRVEEGGSNELPDVPESVAEQIAAVADQALEVAQSVREDADNGEFDGATFTPNVSEAGLLSWTNDKGLPNPQSVNIKGPKGDPGSGGGYEPPAGGIPASDLAPDVQSALGKANTALQEVPSTYRTASAQDTIDNAQDAKINPLYTPVTLTGASVTANIVHRALLTAAEVELPPLQNGTPSESSPIPLQALSSVTVNSTALSLPSGFYGGIVDLLSGTIRSHCRHFVFDGNENWTSSGSGTRRYYSLKLFDGHGVVDINKGILCNYLPQAVITSSTSSVGVSVFESGSSGNTVLGIRPANTDDYTVSSWKSHLSTLYNNGNPYEIVVWVLEPIETAISPLHIEHVASGTIAITTNYGECLVEYDNYIEALSDFAVTRAAVSLIGAKVEKTSTATHEYLANEFIIVNDTLCKATANIQSGGTITIGVNAVVTTITAEITALLNS